LNTHSKIRVDEDDPAVSHVSENCCPVCEAKLDAASPVEGEQQPGPGDVSICFYCTAFLEFDQDMNVIKITQKTLSELSAATLAELIQVRLHIKKHSKKNIH